MIVLREFKDNDIEMFKSWLNEEHIAKWFKDPDSWIYEVNNRKNKFSFIKHFIVQINSEDIGFCQYYTYKDGKEDWYDSDEVEGIYSLDYCIGNTNYLNKGYGKEIVKKMIEKITLDGGKKIIVNPEKDNLPSCNTLKSIGFNYNNKNDYYYYNLVDYKDIVIKKLSNTLIDDYLYFFDNTAHSTGIPSDRCYCVCWGGEDCEGKDFSTWKKRRELAKEYVERGIIKGYLAYLNGKVIGWCNTNKKSLCLKSLAWTMFMKNIPIENELLIKSIYCFTIDPDYQKRGIAKLLLSEVIKGAKNEGFDYVEVYPNKTFINIEDDLWTS